MCVCVCVCVCVCACTHAHAPVISRVRLFSTPWTVAHQATLSMEFSRQEYWSGLPLPSPGDHPYPGIESVSLASPALAGRFFITASPGKPWNIRVTYKINCVIYTKSKQEEIKTK